MVPKMGIGLGGAQTDACKYSKWQLTSSNVPHIPVTGTYGPIGPGGPNCTSGPKYLIKVPKLGNN